jgi:hypothetical protein
MSSKFFMFERERERERERGLEEADQLTSEMWQSSPQNHKEKTLDEALPLLWDIACDELWLREFD